MTYFAVGILFALDSTSAFLNGAAQMEVPPIVASARVSRTVSVAQDLQEMRELLPGLSPLPALYLKGYTVRTDGAQWI